VALTIYQVDAFTGRPFAGNPAAVLILPEVRDDDWLHKVAREMNLSETAFLLEQEDGFDLRWFTPAAEVELCGHATLASAHIMWETGRLAPDRQARFHTLSGLLTARRQDDWIEMDFPAEPAAPVPASEELSQALGIKPRFMGANRFDYLVEVHLEQTVRGLKPDFARLRQVTQRGVIVTSQSMSPKYDFVSRFFAPAVGIDEDPVTGSAHCCLGPFWAKRFGKSELIGYQASARGGIVRVRVGGDRVFLGGQAVTVLRGELYA
jgi:PhzF family phenazine biosynthesis protein